MNQVSPREFRSNQVFDVYAASDLYVRDGVNLGDPLGAFRALCLGDTYRLRDEAQSTRLALRALDANTPEGNPVFAVAPVSEIESAGTRTTISAHLTFITPMGAMLEALLIACDGPAPRHYLYPLNPVEPRINYTLIEANPAPATIPIADHKGLSFARGTRITMSDGSQKTVETLKIGDKVLTRDQGMVAIAWIGRRTVQAAGATAPIVISAGVYGNAEDLALGPEHRVLISDWRAEVMVGARDVLIRALDLVKGDDVFQRSGGFVDYTQIIFEQHQIIYAEGVAVESLPVSRDFVQALPAQAASELRAIFPRIDEEAPALAHPRLKRAQATELLKQAGRS
jgi:hypothetical protein